MASTPGTIDGTAMRERRQPTDGDIGVAATRVFEMRER